MTTTQGNDVMNKVLPDRETIRAALALAVRAPSIHNSQPWLWRVGDETVHLYANHDRQLPEIDSGRRDLLLSCGAALQHFTVALAALGWRSHVHRFPNPDEPEHLAAIEIGSRSATSEQDIALAAAIPRRRTDRRSYSWWPVPAGDIALMGARAARAGVTLRRVSVPGPLTDLLAKAVRTHTADPDYMAELSMWSGRYRSLAGVPARNTPAPESGATVPARVFANPMLAQPDDADPRDDAGTMVALATVNDDPVAQLRAGEATGVVLLTATALGLSTCPVSEPLEIDTLREAVRSDVLDDESYPQMLLRIGWAPINADPLPATPRLPLADVVEGLDGSPI